MILLFIASALVYLFMLLISGWQSGNFSKMFFYTKKLLQKIPTVVTNFVILIFPYSFCEFYFFILKNFETIMGLIKNSSHKFH